LLGLHIPAKGKLLGRVLTEAMPNGATPLAKAVTLRSAPDAAGHVTVVVMQQVGQTRYFDVGGYPGRTLGLPAEAPAPTHAARAHAHAKAAAAKPAVQASK
jgi:hypothetical protein